MRELGAALNPRLDRVVRPSLRLGGQSIPVFRLCGYAGLAGATGLALALAAAAGLSLWVEAMVIVVAVATFLGLALATNVVTGRENLIYYHHEVAVLGISALFVGLLGEPVLAHLDATALGLGVFLACGRAGCLLVGCCHGRPARIGPRYGVEHAHAGFPACLVGVRLGPVQALESLAVLALVGAGVVAIAAGASPGTATVWYVTAYAVVRFFLEFLRGDHLRRYLWGFSEAQWTSIVLASAGAAGGLLGLLPEARLSGAGTLVLASAMVGTAVARSTRGGTTHRLLGARHVWELAQALDVSRAASRSPVQVTETSLCRLSAGSTAGVAHYALSLPTGALRLEEAEALASLILRLRHPESAAEVVPGTAGVFHVVLGGARVARVASAQLL